VAIEREPSDPSPAPISTESSPDGPGSFPAWFPVLVAVLLGAVILIIAMIEEPYHVDELLQTRAYDLPMSEVVASSFAQEQPPLDSVLNATLQRFIGVGDLQQRALSVIFGIGSLVIFGTLALRSRMRAGAGASVLVLAVSPLLVSVTAYARPYALPLFLLLLFLLATDIWLTERRFWSVGVFGAAALLLPLSRTIEPNLVLGATVIVLLAWKLLRRPDWKGSVWLPIGAGLMGLIGVGLPVLMRLQEELAHYTTPDLIRWIGLSRWFTDIPRVVGDSFAPWPLFLVVGVVAVVLPGSRRLLTRTWWFWVLAFVPLAFATVFVLRTPESQSFAIRYTFTWWPPFAMMVGAIVGGVLESQKTLRRSWQLAAVSLVAVLFIVLGASIRSDLSSRGRYDFAALGSAINTVTSADTTKLFDPVTPQGSYRTGFSGRWGRYLPRSRVVPQVILVAGNPGLVPESSPIAVALIDYRGNVPGWPIDVPGWQRIETGPYDNLYLPVAELAGRSGARAALVSFADALGPDRGAAFALAAGSLAAADGEQDVACSILADLQAQSGEVLLGRIDTQLERAGEGGSWTKECPEA
jgi:hypothetical protein